MERPETTTEDFEQTRARVAREGVEHAGMLLKVLATTYQGTERQRERQQVKTLRVYRNYLYWARVLNPGYEPPAEAHALAQAMDPRIE